MSPAPSFPALFIPSVNCRDIAQSSHASVLVDCANYYSALHAAICNARHSIFILGWDIDSRIELLRGKEASLVCPNHLYELILWKACENPDLQIYLNRWDFSVFMAAEKELWSQRRWDKTPANVHFHFDDQAPLGACHHQKIAVIDDEIAFSGGMDVAIARWDHRHHHVENSQRKDPEPTLKAGEHEFSYGPYHDVQILVAGDTARVLAQIARERWLLATGKPATPLRMPIRVGALQAMPASWPAGVEVEWQDVSTALSLTVPAYKQQQQPVRQVLQLYLDMIAQAKHFIYIENQFLTQQEIAQALNHRLRAVPALQVVLLSCDKPDGVMEKKSMWYGRVLFKDILLAGGVGDRVVMAYPVSCEHGIEKPVRIHSKVMIVDDLYLRVGSSNINNRSMGLDTECDLVLQAHDAASRQRIARVRNDLVREHTGHDHGLIEAIVAGQHSVQKLYESSASIQHLRVIDDEQYRHESFAGLAVRIADSERALLPSLSVATYPGRLLGMLALIATLILVWEVTPLSRYASPEQLQPLLESLVHTDWAWPAAFVLYVLATLLFFPHVVITAAMVLVFPPMQAFAIAMLGSLLSGSIGFAAGRGLGSNVLQALTGHYADRIAAYAQRGGVVGVTLLRMLPVAPYSVVNLALGMLKIKFSTFVIATVLGMLPGTVISVLLGSSLMQLWHQPGSQHWWYLAGGIGLWVAVILGTHLFARRWQAQQQIAGA